MTTVKSLDQVSPFVTNEFLTIQIKLETIFNIVVMTEVVCRSSFVDYTVAAGKEINNVNIVIFFCVVIIGKK